MVGLGTRVNVTDLNANHPDTFTIMGAWDSDPDKGLVSYLSPLAQALLNKKPGEEVEFEMDGVKKCYRIEAIEAVQSAAPVPQTPTMSASP